MMKIILVEDDPDHAKMVQAGLEAAFKSQNVKIERIATESGFRRQLDQIVKSPPRLLIMDVMLRWTDPSPNTPEAPVDVKQEGYYRAGLRCQKLLSEKDPTIPVILYSILEAGDLENEMKSIRGQVWHLSKERNLEPLISKTRSVLGTASTQ